MAHIPFYNYIIAGGGASGLALLWQLMSHRKKLGNPSILLVDQNLGAESTSKTWCFWEREHLPYPELIHHSWKHLEVRHRQSMITLTPQRHGYHCISSNPFRNYILEKARQSDNVTLLESPIEELRYCEEDKTPKAITADGTFRAEWIFQSCFRPPKPGHALETMPLKQHFLGWEVQLNRPLLDEKTATFMDFDVEQQPDGMSFMYVLPFRPTRALFEYTVFGRKLAAEEVYKEQIRSYLYKRLGLREKDYRVVRSEQGVIPMTDRKFPGRHAKRILNIGIGGGTAKPSTGYSFMRAHKHAAEIVQNLVRKKDPAPFSSPYRYRVYDLQLLHILYHHPKKSVGIFDALFRNNPIDRLLDFLAEESSLAQDLAVMNSVPYGPFLRALNAVKGRIVMGR